MSQRLIAASRHFGRVNPPGSPTIPSNLASSNPLTELRHSMSTEAQPHSPIPITHDRRPQTRIR